MSQCIIVVIIIIILLIIIIIIIIIIMQNVINMHIIMYDKQQPERHLYKVFHPRYEW